MSDLPDIGMLWMRGTLSVVERLCMQSFLDAGHRVLLYTYDGVTNPPDGVDMRDANEILPEETELIHGRTGSPAPHADRWRYHLLSKSDNLIWADTDAYCVKPFTTETGHFYAWESARNVNVGVLALPRDSKTLKGLIDFTNDIYAIPPWFSSSQKAELQALKDAGTPAHAGDMVWGVWGPHALTHFLKTTGEIKHALPEHVLYPVPYAERRKMVRPNIDLSHYIKDDTLSIHFYGRRMRAHINEKYGGVPPKNSLFGGLMALHGVEAQPISQKPQAKPTNSYADALLNDYGSEKLFMQNLHMPANDPESRPFVFVKNQGSGNGSGSIIGALMHKVAQNKGLQDSQDINFQAVHSPSSKVILAGPKRVDRVQAFDQLQNGDAFRFTFMRDPKAHLLWGYTQQIQNNPKKRRLLLDHLGEKNDREISLSEYLSIIASDAKARHLIRQLRPQFDELSLGHIDYDFIGRFENFDDDFTRAYQQIFNTAGAVPWGDMVVGNEGVPTPPKITLSEDDQRNFEIAYARDIVVYDKVGRDAANFVPSPPTDPIPTDEGVALFPAAKPIAENPVPTAAPSEADTKAAWIASMQKLGDEHGFFKQIGENHSGLFIKRGKTLMITFENLDHVYEGYSADKLPWGFAFVENEGFSMLGMMAHDWTWYREDAVYDFFDDLRDSGFYDQFDKVVFYGASMGGYAAAAFSASRPNSEVILISPQATLEGSKVDHFETRYEKGKARDFTTRYGYAPDMVKSAKQVFVFYDPLSRLDTPHAQMFDGANVRKLHCPFFGHRIMTLWLRMGILKKTVLSCIDGSFTERKFYRDLRKRREDTRYQREMLDRLVKRGNDYWVAYYTRAVLNRRGGPKFRSAMKNAAANLENAGRNAPDIREPDEMAIRA